MIKNRWTWKNNDWSSSSIKNSEIWRPETLLVKLSKIKSEHIKRIKFTNPEVNIIKNKICEGSMVTSELEIRRLKENDPINKYENSIPKITLNFS